MSESITTPALLLDASASTVQVGILDNGKWLAFHSKEEQALVSLFSGLDLCLKSADLDFNSIKSFIFCEGPGSTLGIRLSAMAIRTWSALNQFRDAKIYSYNSMHLALEILKKTTALEFPIRIITESRMKRWNQLLCESTESPCLLSEVESSAIKPNDTKTWHIQPRLSPPPIPVENIEYNLEPHPECFKMPLLKISENPDAYTAVHAEYKRWLPQLHSKK